MTHSPDAESNCTSCGESFKTPSELNSHVLKHTTDGDWNCLDCAFQTNSSLNLTKHTEVSHTKAGNSTSTASQSTPFPCNLCNEKFSAEPDLLEHRRNQHKTFKPFRNLSNCPYQEACIFNHKPTNSNLFLCYECGNELKMFSTLMLH